MPQFDITVANIFYLRLEADTAEEAQRIAKVRIASNESHEQRILAMTQIKDD